MVGVPAATLTTPGRVPPPVSLFDQLRALLSEPGEGSGRDSSDAVASDAAPDGGDPDDAPGPGASRTAAGVAVIVQRAPAGVEKYTADVRVDGGEIAAVEPGALAAHFRVAAGGVGADRASLRAVDFRGEAAPGDGPVPLFTLRFAEPVPPSAIDLTIESLVGHDGAAIDRDAVRFTALD